MSGDFEKKGNIGKRGLASADAATRERVSQKGGETVSRNRAHMSEIGKRGGEEVSRNSTHMSEIGKKGGESVSRNIAHMSEIGKRGGESSRSRKSSKGKGSEDGTQNAGKPP